MKWFKRIVTFIVFVFVLFIGAVAIIGTQYKEEVVSFVKNELGKKLTREVKVGKIEYSLFSNFPNISVDLVSLETYSFKPGDTPFLQLDKLHLVFDIIPLIQGEFELGEIILEEGQVNIIYGKNGEPNFNIVKEGSDSRSEQSSFSIDILQLKNVNVAYQNWEEDEDYIVSFKECFVSPNSLIDSIDANLEFEGNIPSLMIGGGKSEKAIELDGEFKIWLNDDFLGFNYSGQFASGDANIKGELNFSDKNEQWDIQCEMLNHNVQDLVKILPSEFKDEVLRSFEGDISASLKILGEKTDDKFPPVQVDFNFSNGSFKSKNEQFRGVFVSGMYFQPNTKSISGAKARIDKYSLNYNGIVVRGHGTIKELKNPFISATVQSSFNLKKLYGVALKDEFKTLSGDVVFDMDFSGRLIEVFVNNSKKDLKDFKSQGNISFLNIIAQPSDFDYPISIEKGKLNFSNRDLLFDSFTGKILSSSFSMDGRIKNYLKTIFEDEPLAFAADLKMDKMILEEFISDSSDNQNADYQFNLPKSISLNTNLELGMFSFRKFIAHKVKGEMLLKNQKLSFHNLDMNTCDGSVHLNGSIDTENTKKIIYKCTSKFKNIDAEKAFTQFENFGQDVLLQKHVKGTISLHTFLLAESDKQLNILEDKIYTETQLNIYKGELIYFEPLVELQEFLKQDLKLNFNLTHLKFETLQNDIKINNGVITIPEMAIRSSDINVDIAGKHTFNQDIDYLLKIKHNEIFKANKQNKIDAEFGIIENNDKTATLPLRMKGNIDDPKFTYDTKTKMGLISDSWKREGKEIKKVFIDEFGGIFKSKKNKPTSLNSENEDLNNTSPKTETIITWDEDEEDEEDEEDD